MCNANNHPPGCSCGWGGVWYGSAHDDAAWLFNRAPPPRKLGRQKGTFGALAGIVTVPNSRCPVCGATVFYYESPYGGRVFFDALGPPWPKHPCTDNGVSRTPAQASSKPWHAKDWLPITEASIEMEVGETDVYSLNGMRGGRRYRFFFKSREIVMAEVIRVKPADKGVFLVSILDFHAPHGEWAIWTGSLFSTKEALKAVALPLKRTKLHSHFLKHPTGNPLLRAVPQVVSAAQPVKLAAPATRVEEFVRKEEHSQIELARCPDCQARISERNLLKHLRRIHGYIPLGTSAKITGQMLLNEV